MIKLITLLLALFCIVYGSNTIVKRTAFPEEIALEIEYLGTCNDFITKDLASLRVSVQANDSCLPILTTTGNDDVNNLHSDYHCTNIRGGRSIVQLVEIYQVHGTPFSDYIVSFVPSHPFRARTSGVEVTYLRRPDCIQEENYCTGTLSITGCNDNFVTFHRQYVNNRDRIYLLPKPKLAHTCSKDSVCCNYISTAGYCPYKAPTALLERHNNHESYGSIIYNNHYNHDNNHNDHHEHNNHHENNHNNDHHEYNNHHNNTHNNTHNNHHENNHQGNHHNNDHQNNHHGNHQNNDHNNHNNHHGNNNQGNHHNNDHQNNHHGNHQNNGHNNHNNHHGNHQNNVHNNHANHHDDDYDTPIHHSKEELKSEDDFEDDRKRK